jgi:hypothetical protein
LLSNARILLRNNTLVKNGYSQHFEYSEAMLTGKGLIGIGIVVGVGGCEIRQICYGCGYTAYSLDDRKLILPKPGEGGYSSLDTQEKGFYYLRFLAKLMVVKKFAAKLLAIKIQVMALPLKF